MGKNVTISTLPNIGQNYLPKINTSSIFANSLVYDNGSSVLINTTTASAFRLDVNGSIRATSGTLTGALSGTSATFSSSVTATSESFITGGDGAGKMLKFTGGTTKYNFMIAAQQNVNNGLEITPSSAAGGSTFSTPAIVVTSGGNVGIGYTSPNYPLQVHSSTSISRIQLTNSSTGTASGDGFQIIADGVNATLSLPETGYMSFETSNAERMRITSGGNLEVGNASRTAATSISLINDANSNGAVFGYARNAGQYLTGAGAGDLIIGNATNENILFGNTQTGTTEYMRITSGGNVLINTTTNGSGQLQVNGAINNVGSGGMSLGSLGGRRRIQWDTGNAEAIILGDNDGYFPIGASAFNTRSDYRLKEDLKEFNGLSLVSSMKVYDFKWKEKDERNYGFIAHELQEIIPYIVTGKKDAIFEDKPLYQGMDSSKIVPVLVKAIQELKAEIDTLKK